MRKIILFALLLGGCASTEQMILYRPDMTSKLLGKDAYECEKDTRTVRFGKYENAFAFSIRCMESKGWSYIPASALTPETIARIRGQWNDQ